MNIQQVCIVQLKHRKEDYSHLAPGDQDLIRFVPTSTVLLQRMGMSFPCSVSQQVLARNTAPRAVLCRAICRKQTLNGETCCDVKQNKIKFCFPGGDTPSTSDLCAHCKKLCIALCLCFSWKTLVCPVNRAACSHNGPDTVFVAHQLQVVRFINSSSFLFF